jgi:lantibiotic biosynthesis protein
MFDDPPAVPSSLNPISGWSQNLGTGAAGTALLHIARAHAGLGNWATAHWWATAMTRQPITVAPDASGLFDGPMAVAYALRTARQDAYAGALDTLDRHVNALTQCRLARAHERIDRAELPAMREYDLISGLTGTGAYLLHRGGDDGLLKAVLGYLVRLTTSIPSAAGSLPGWWTSHGPSDRPEPDWIGGHANLGMAHGIAGPLALLSIAARRDIIVSGQLDAIHQIGAWLDSWRIGTDTHTWWPGMISLPEYRDQAVHHASVQRPSWCYGTPGLARAQQLAAIATGNKSRQQSAENALVECLDDPRQLALLTDATVCHGLAGVVLTTWRIAADAPDRVDLAAQLTRLRDGLTDQLHRGEPPTRDGLLEGRPGGDLVEHIVRRPPDIPWDACLLLIA